MRAVVEYHGPDADSFPPINVIVGNGENEVTIKVSDQGGGIARSIMSKIWSYTYTTGVCLYLRLLHTGQIDRSSKFVSDLLYFHSDLATG